MKWKASWQLALSFFPSCVGCGHPELRCQSHGIRSPWISEPMQAGQVPWEVPGPKQTLHGWDWGNYWYLCYCSIDPSHKYTEKSATFGFYFSIGSLWIYVLLLFRYYFDWTHFKKSASQHTFMIILIMYPYIHYYLYLKYVLYLMFPFTSLLSIWKCTVAIIFDPEMLNSSILFVTLVLGHDWLCEMCSTRWILLLYFVLVT